MEYTLCITLDIFHIESVSLALGTGLWLFYFKSLVLVHFLCIFFEHVAKLNGNLFRGACRHRPTNAPNRSADVAKWNLRRVRFAQPCGDVSSDPGTRFDVEQALFREVTQRKAQTRNFWESTQESQSLRSLMGDNEEEPLYGYNE